VAQVLTRWEHLTLPFALITIGLIILI